MKKCVFLFIASILLLGCQEQKPKTAEKELIFITPSELDLGEIEQNKIIDLQFHIVNKSDNDVKITSQAKSCGCTDFIEPVKHIKAHSDELVKIQFNPEKENKSFSKSVFIRLNNSKILIFKFKGIIKS